MKKRFAFLVVFLITLFFCSSVNASVYINPKVRGVIANSMYSPSVTYVIFF